jgi:hypothetical protein
LDYLFKKSTNDKSEKRLEHRAWYHTLSDWTNESASGLNKENIDTVNVTDVVVEDASDVYLVAFDEHFTRCPITKEQFETFWDDEEGGLMFRNAVRVLVRESVDPKLYEISKPTEAPDVRYVIVHKLLVMDGWMSSGKAIRLSSLQSESKQELLIAAGDDDCEDVFVIMS